MNCMMFKFEKHAPIFVRQKSCFMQHLGQNGKASFSQLTLPVNYTAGCEMLNKISIDFVCGVNMHMSTCGMCMPQEEHMEDKGFQGSILLLPHTPQESNLLWEGPLPAGQSHFTL